MTSGLPLPLTALAYMDYKLIANRGIDTPPLPNENESYADWQQQHEYCQIEGIFERLLAFSKNSYLPIYDQLSLIELCQLFDVDCRQK